MLILILNLKKNVYINQQINDWSMRHLLPPILLPENFHHKRLAKGDLTSQQNFSNTKKLSKLTDSNSGVKYIYTLVLKDNKIFFTSSSATKEERDSGQGLTSFFDQYQDVEPRVYEVLSSNQMRFLEYTDQWGCR